MTVLAQMKELQGVAVSESDGTIAPLSNTEKMWLSSECIQRYLRATKWDVDATAKRLKNTLVWRRTIGLGEGGKLTNDEYIREEQLTGKQLILGFDNQSRPLWYMKPDRQNTQESPRQTDHAYFMLECARLLCPQGVETVSLLINYAKKWVVWVSRTVHELTSSIELRVLVSPLANPSCTSTSSLSIVTRSLTHPLTASPITTQKPSARLSSSTSRPW